VGYLEPGKNADNLPGETLSIKPILSQVYIEYRNSFVKSALNPGESTGHANGLTENTVNQDYK
jgi:hypothetical protein